MNLQIGNITEDDLYLFKQGKHYRLFDKLGSHLTNWADVSGTTFSVWAPNAKYVSVIGSFNHWNPDMHPMTQKSNNSGVWEVFVPDVEQGATYKYHIISCYNNFRVDRGDPLAFCWEQPPQTASKVWNLDYSWADTEWMKHRAAHNSLTAPMAIYEIHLGSWRRKKNADNAMLTYREMAECLPAYISDLGFTHVEFMPLTEHPFYGSWGYQTTGYFAATSRYGSPQDLMYLIDRLHQQGIGVILDWVPSHFPHDAHGLHYFDGTFLFEHADPKKGFQPQWNSYTFNYGRPEVRAFLISSAIFWLEKYHFDGLRVDAVASMLYLDYGRQSGEWIPNEYGGNENLEAVEFLKLLNTEVYEKYSDVQLIAEESTAWPMVSRPCYLGGLGFGMKWNMGWMHDTLDFFAIDPLFRTYHLDRLTFSLCYAFNENFILPFSHDEVVHGKKSLLEKMPGDQWQKFANLRLLYGVMYAHPGKKLLFMGSEFGPWREWDHDTSLDWDLTQRAEHAGLQYWLQDLNHRYRREAALYEMDFSAEGFEWVNCRDIENTTLSFIRRSAGSHTSSHTSSQYGRANSEGFSKTSTDEAILIICNFTPIPRHNFRVGVPIAGWWQELLNSDAAIYGGSGAGNLGRIESLAIGCDQHPYSLTLLLPPLAILFLKCESTR